MSLRIKLMLALLLTGLAAVAVVGGLTYSSVNTKFDTIRSKQAGEHFHRFMTAYLTEYGDWKTAIATESFDRFVQRTERLERGDGQGAGGERPSDLIERMPPNIDMQSHGRPPPDAGQPPGTGVAAGVAPGAPPAGGAYGRPQALPPTERGLRADAPPRRDGGGRPAPPDGARPPRPDDGRPQDLNRSEADQRRGPPDGRGPESDERRGPPPDGRRPEFDDRRGPPPDGRRPEFDDRRAPPPDGRRPEFDERRGPPPDGRRPEGDEHRGPPPEGRRPPQGERGAGPDGRHPPQEGDQRPWADKRAPQDGERRQAAGSYARQGGESGAQSGATGPQDGGDAPQGGVRAWRAGARQQAQEIQPAQPPARDPQQAPRERQAPAARDLAAPAPATVPAPATAAATATATATATAPATAAATATATAAPPAPAAFPPAGDGAGPPRRPIHERGGNPPPFRFVLTDADYNVLLGAGLYGAGAVLPVSERGKARPIEVNGKVAAYVSTEGVVTPSRQELEFLDAMRSSLAAGAGGAAVLALGLGLALSRGLSSRLSHLTRAVRAMHGGSLRQQVPVQGKDEVATLASAFNEMSEQLARSHEELQASHQTIMEQADQLRELSIRDVLTSLYNRRHFDEQACTLYNQAVRHKRPLSLVIGDIDFFKKINDNYSHATGDAVLRRVGAILRQHVRLSDLVARYGGEEFVLALPETDLPNAAALCDKLRVIIEQHPWHEVEPGLKVTMSMGVFADYAVGTAEAMLQKADELLYHAKETGRNRVCHA
ncbi:diguanylate cyclase [Pseudoduganella sp. LjRoot289]|uniref:sensor domain-containing diguanylate cyclase n=1 Tax=Pseudoduganella sp. LjRoot289 TaxID=3342314 RepID=UPI003ECFFAC6